MWPRIKWLFLPYKACLNKNENTSRLQQVEASKQKNDSKCQWSSQQTNQKETLCSYLMSEMYLGVESKFVAGNYGGKTHWAAGAIG